MNFFQLVPDDIIVEIMQKHLEDVDDVRNCYISCKRFHYLISKKCKDKLLEEHYWFKKTAERMKLIQQDGLSSIRDSFKNCPIEVGAQRIITTTIRHPNNLFGKIKQKVTGKTSSTTHVSEVANSVVLLGIGRSGKRYVLANVSEQTSTFLRQMGLMYANVTTENLRLYRSFNRRNLVNTLLLHLQYICDEHNLEWVSKNRQWADQMTTQLQTIVKENSHMVDQEEDNPHGLLSIIDELLKEPKFRTSLRWNADPTSPHRTCNPSLLEYLLSIRKQLYSPDYSSTCMDVVMTNIRTTGIIETTIGEGNTRVKILDVGGERKERRKWVHCFGDNTKAILFFVSLSSYDMVLAEDHTKNRMDESLEVLGDIAKNELFKNYFMITVFTHVDEFRDKLRKYPLSKHFPEYSGTSRYEESLQFIVEKCKALFPPNRSFQYVTMCTVDTESVLQGWFGILKLMKEHCANVPDIQQVVVERKRDDRMLLD